MALTKAEEEFAGMLGKHFISLNFYYSDVKGEADKLASISGFVMLIQDDWFFITAGHILRTVDQIIEQGAVVRRWSIFDGLGTDAKFDDAIPFDYASSQKGYCYDAKFEYDYAIIHLSEYYCNLLKANGITPLSEEYLLSPEINRVDAYYMLGIPQETVLVLEPSANVRGDAFFLRVTPEQNPPHNLIKPFPRFYGRLEGPNSPPSIEGMSGGPIFAIKREDSGAIRYWVIAVQSGWNSKERVIAACFIRPFFEFANAQILEAQQQNLSEK